LIDSITSSDGGGKENACRAAGMDGCAVMAVQAGDRAYVGDLRGLQARSDG
jgi:hypothetical protein